MEIFEVASLGFYFVCIIIALFVKILSSIKKDDENEFNENSFQRFAKFYGETIPSDAEFNNKLNKICSLIKGGETDIKKIAELSSCTEAECIFKIKYLKNKRMIEDYNIDTFKMRLYTLNAEDERLLKKYNTFLYGTHPQIDVIAHILAKQENKTVDEEKEIIFKELKYLDDRNLLNGIKINDVDKKLIYYTVEKRKTSNLLTVHCPNCGALNDIDEGNKTRCAYCNTIIEGDNNHD